MKRLLDEFALDALFGSIGHLYLLEPLYFWQFDYRTAEAMDSLLESP
jgi:hypothetical protein